MRRADIRLTNDCTISVISDNIKIDSFSCGDRELDEYFKERSVRYTSELLSKNYAFVTDSGEIVTAFSYSNYCINSQQLPGNVRNRLQRKIPNLKRMRSYPALLIGRLGVDVRYHGLGLGSQTLDFIMRLYLHPDAGVCIESSGNETAGKPHIHLIHCGQLSVSDNNFIMLQQNIRLSGATVVVTGVAGFIGASLTRRLLDEYPDCRVIGIDNIN